MVTGDIIKPFNRTYTLRMGFAEGSKEVIQKMPPKTHNLIYLIKISGIQLPQELLDLTHLLECKFINICAKRN